MAPGERMLTLLKNPLTHLISLAVTYARILFLDLSINNIKLKVLRITFETLGSFEYFVFVCTNKNSCHSLTCHPINYPLNNKPQTIYKSYINHYNKW
jgi:hypothetical protein